MTAEQCRPHDDIHKLAQGMLSEEEAAAALTHIESCPKCEARLTAAERNPNPIFTSLRHGKPAVPLKRSPPQDRSLLWEYRAAYGSVLAVIFATAVFAAWDFLRDPKDARIAEVMNQMAAANPGFDGAYSVRRASDGKTIALAFASDVVQNLSPLRRLPMPIALQIAATKPGGQLADVSTLAGLELIELDVRNCPVSDFTPLQTTPIQRLWADIDPARDAKALGSISSLRTINDQPSLELLTPAKPKEQQ